MGRKRYTAEQIIGMLREAEVLQSQGMTIGEISRKLVLASKRIIDGVKNMGECGLTRPKGSKSSRKRIYV